MKILAITEEMKGKRFEGTLDGVQVKGVIDEAFVDDICGNSQIHVKFDEPTKFWVADDFDEIFGGHYEEFTGATLLEGEFGESNIKPAVEGRTDETHRKILKCESEIERGNRCIKNLTGCRGKEADEMRKLARERIKKAKMELAELN